LIRIDNLEANVHHLSIAGNGEEKRCIIRTEGLFARVCRETLSHLYADYRCYDTVFPGTTLHGIAGSALISAEFLTFILIVLLLCVVIAGQIKDLAY